MPVDYAEVLKDLDAQIAVHKTAMDELQAARPAIVALRNKMNVTTAKPYTGMGATAAIRALLSANNAWFTTQDIFDKLIEGGYKSDSPEPIKVISSTLSQLKSQGYIDRQDDKSRWMPIRSVPLNTQATAPSIDW